MPTSISSRGSKATKSDLNPKEVAEYATLAPPGRTEDVYTLLLTKKDHIERIRTLGSWWDEAESGKFQLFFNLELLTCMIR